MKTRIFYGWIIVAASVVILALGLGMFTSTNSVYVKPVCQSLGFARSEFTLHRTIMTLVGALVLPIFGKFLKKSGVRKVLLVGALGLSLVNIGYSFANSLWHFYALAFVNGLFLHAVNFMIIGILISSWFEDKRGMANGIAFAGSGLGGAIMIPIVTRIIEAYDWRAAYRFMGIVGFIILIPIILLIIKDSPSKMGLSPYISQKTEADKNKKLEGPVFDLSLREVFKTGRFWLMAIGYFFISVFAAATNTHSAPYLSDIGYSNASVAPIISVFMLSLTFGKILMGFVYDRYGTLAGNAFIAVCSLIFPLAALLARLPIFPWIYAITVGVASCAMSVPVSILITKYFGTKDYPTIFSIITMISTFGPSISVPVMGAVFDYTGSYRPAWIALFIFSFIVSICLLAAELSYRKKHKQLSNTRA